MSTEFGLIALIGLCVGVFFWVVINAYYEAKAAMVITDQRRAEVQSQFFKMLIPLARPLGETIRGIFPRAVDDEDVLDMGSDKKKSFRQRLAHKLMMAGSPEGLTPEEFIGLILISGFVGVFGGLGLSYWLMIMFKVNYFVLIVPVCSLLGFFFPGIWLRDTIKKRHTEIRRSLPFSLDLLTLSVEAGLDFTQALERIISKLGKTALAQEFNETLHAIRMGRSRGDALRDTGRRAGVSEMSTVLGALIQADELGASLGPILRIQSEMLRVKRSQLAEKMAMQAPVKILFPLVVFIFPTTFIIIIVPILLKLFGVK